MAKLFEDPSLHRSFKLFLLILALTCSAVLVGVPPDANANMCSGYPNTAFPMRVTYYFTDATYSTISCIEDECNSSWCDPTPYSQTYTYCCTPP